MDKLQRFRYANEMVGGFVLLSMIMLVVGLFIAGRAQGWFERKVVLHTSFSTTQGALGLKEGDEVRIGDTVAGNVGKIVPGADGSIRTTFQIKRGFMPLLRKGSVAKVRKKFGLAGDSIVEIELGKGDPLKDGDIVECRKDEELMDTAKNMLTKAQEVIMPIMEEIRKILEHFNSIAADVETKDGVAGAIIRDEELTRSVKKTVNSLNGLVSDTREAVIETKRLIKGAQKHWLVRKYMEKDKDPELLVSLSLNPLELNSEISVFRKQLKQARLANDSASIAFSAYNLAVCLMDKGEYKLVPPLLHEARSELKASAKSQLCTYILEAQALQKTGNIADAVSTIQLALGMLRRSEDEGVALQCRVVAADLLRQTGKMKEAKSEIKKAESLADKIESPLLKSLSAGVGARIMLTEENPAGAGVMFDRESELLRSAGLFQRMAEELENAGNAHRQARNYTAAADRYFRAGRSLFSDGRPARAANALKNAVESAKMAKDQAQLARIDEFLGEVENTLSAAD